LNTDGAPFFDGTQPCTQYDVETFFDDSGTLSAGVCTGAISPDATPCPFITACADYAVPRPWLVGVWGGMSHARREKVRKASRIPAIQREWE
jgi:hypothetical protein